jgi:hypothetical protein
MMALYCCMPDRAKYIPSERIKIKIPIFPPLRPELRY